MTVAGKEADAGGVAPGHDAEAVVLDLMNPVRPGRRSLGRGRQARFDKDHQTAATHTQHDWALDCVDLEPGEIWPSSVYQIAADKLGEEMTLEELQKFKDETFEERVECSRRRIAEIEAEILEHKKAIDSF